MPHTKDTVPANANACLLMADGTMFFGTAIGKAATVTGEICFNTSMTGYQEILTDPSYAGQIITFTAPHIGNVGCNAEDMESGKAGTAHPRLGAVGLIVREIPTLPSSFRSQMSLQAWLEKNNISGIAGVDTRAITRHIRKHGAQNVIIFGIQASGFKLQEAKEVLSKAPSMKGLDLAKSVTTKKPCEWTKGLWHLTPESRNPKTETLHVVAIDYGAKHNILRCIADRGCRITVVPATTSAEEILKLKPDGIFLSNGPGDPAATGVYALPEIKKLMETGIPIFGICLGHQLLGLAMGGKTEKMPQGHRGANHPVKDLQSGKVIITSQNHGFVVSKDGLPADVEVTHLSLFDGTIQGLRHKTKPIFCMQGHPEASPGPHDSQYLFDTFAEMIRASKDESAVVRKKNA
ncbi:MAG: glutamine-hydrolyzing carbamoyl-phosphate synthase small subunit [Alphaproteobacteria bacterium]